MGGDGVPAYLAHLYGTFMQVGPAARPILRRLFFMYAARDWAKEVPASVMGQAAAGMSAMHHALERGDYAEAPAQLRAWAGLLGGE